MSSPETTTKTDWRKVDGWLTDAEGEALANLARGLVVVELGSWKGRSTVCMAATALSITACDTFRGDEHTGPSATLGDFLANTRDCPNVVAITADFNHGLLSVPSQSADLVFIDGQHDSASAYRDAMIARRILKPGGTVAFHDFNASSVAYAAGLAGVRIEGIAGSLAWGEFFGPNVGDVPMIVPHKAN